MWSMSESFLPLLSSSLSSSSASSSPLVSSDSATRRLSSFHQGASLGESSVAEKETEDDAEEEPQRLGELREEAWGHHLDPRNRQTDGERRSLMSMRRRRRGEEQEDAERRDRRNGGGEEEQEEEGEDGEKDRQLGEEDDEIARMIGKCRVRHDRSSRDVAGRASSLLPSFFLLVFVAGRAPRRESEKDR